MSVRPIEEARKICIHENEQWKGLCHCWVNMVPIDPENYDEFFRIKILVPDFDSNKEC